MLFQNFEAKFSALRENNPLNTVRASERRAMDGGGQRAHVSAATRNGVSRRD